MEAEVIDKAAIDSCVIDNGIFTPQIIPYYEQGFRNGAEWRINSVWHNINEKPINGAKIIVLRSKHSPIICGPFNFVCEETVEVFSLKKWAYVEDLMPNMEE